MEIALTFDDGPSQATPAVLDLLAKHEARATFFVIGEAIEGRREVLERIVHDGHELGNHTWSHPRLASECDDRRVRAELARTNDAVRDVVALELRRFRAPYYDVDARVAAVAEGIGLRHSRATVAPPDWSTNLRGTVVSTLVLGQLQPGAIVGLHDGAPADEGGAAADRSNLLDALRIILPRLAETGVASVTLSELEG